MEDKIIELETKIAFQESTIQDLNHIVVSLQSEMVLVNKRLQMLHDQMRQLQPSNVAHASEETPPPHY